jgi:hypothetical protein
MNNLFQNNLQTPPLSTKCKTIAPAVFRFLILFVLLFSFVSLQAQTTDSSDYNAPVLYYFPIDRAELLHDYENNALMLDALDRLLDNPAVYPHIASIRITAAASPIAPTAYNRHLSERRAKALQDYIQRKHPRVNKNTTYLYSMGIDWEGFRAVVEAADRSLPARDEILALLDNEPNKETVLLRLRTIGGEATSHYLLRVIYPQLQYATLRIRLTDGTFIPAGEASALKIYVEQNLRDTVAVSFRDTVAVALHDTVWISSPEKPCPEPATTEAAAVKHFPRKKGYCFGVKTNLLYDAALLPNVSLEFPAGKAWSVVVEGMGSWWTFGKPARSYHRIQAGGVEVRRWLASPSPLTGHALGIYALGGAYDIRLWPKNDNSKGWLSNGSYSAGLSYAYSMPIAPRFHLELGLAAGYWGGRYSEYKFHTNENHERWEQTSVHRRHYWGITRAELSLVWIIGTKNKNGKGGAR